MDADCPYHVIGKKESLKDKLFNNYTSTIHFCSFSTGNCVASKEQWIGQGTFNKDIMKKCPIYQAHSVVSERMNNPSLKDVINDVLRYSWNTDQINNIKGNK